MITPLYTANVTLYVRSTQARLDGSDSFRFFALFTVYFFGKGSNTARRLM